jgi:exopolyphosphatase/guanosine-5'-triphosphate,3'-diphosphate pyrophosphatase
VDWAIETEKDIKKQKDGSLILSPKINVRTEEVTQEIRLNLARFKTNKTFGIATGIYRSLLNGKNILAQYSKVLGAEIQLLTNDEEAKIGLDSIVAKEKPQGQFVVWDFGGNNMQFTIVDGQKIQPLLGHPGSNSIKHSVLKLLRKKSTPNPITQTKRQQVETSILTHSFKGLDPQLFPKEISVFGIGAVHARSIGGNIETMLGQPIQDRTYSIDQVNLLAQKFVDLNDQDVGGRYPESQATNILTVHALMRKMGWKQVTFSDETLTLGYMLQVLKKDP